MWWTITAAVLKVVDDFFAAMLAKDEATLKRLAWVEPEGAPRWGTVMPNSRDASAAAAPPHFAENRTMNPTPVALPPSFSTPEFRAALGTFATGVTVITACDEAARLDGRAIA